MSGARGRGTGPIAIGLGALVLFLIMFTAQPAAAATTLVRLWGDSFENGGDGWEMQAYTRDDQVRVVTTAPCGDEATNSHLQGRSPEPKPGAGFHAMSPTFDRMGLQEFEPYVIRFRYRLPHEGACWTYALASQDVSLVVAECDLDAGLARIVVVDELGGTAVTVATVPMESWHDISVRVEPVPMTGRAHLCIRVNGGPAVEVVHSQRTLFDRLVFRDLPYRPVDASLPLPPGGCFGSGEWDDVEVFAVRREPGPPPRDVHFRVEPNPMNPSTAVRFDLARDADVRLEVFDLAGRRVRGLFAGRLPAGPQSVVWDGSDDRGAAVASGTYFLRVIVDGGAHHVRAALVR